MKIDKDKAREASRNLPTTSESLALVFLNNTIDQRVGEMLGVLRDIRAELDAGNKIKKERLDTLVELTKTAESEAAAVKEVHAAAAAHARAAAAAVQDQAAVKEARARAAAADQVQDQAAEPEPETKPKTAEWKIARHKSFLFPLERYTKDQVMNIVVCAPTWLKKDLARAFGCTMAEVPKKMADDMGFSEKTDEPEAPAEEKTEENI